MVKINDDIEVVEIPTLFFEMGENYDLKVKSINQRALNLFQLERHKILNKSIKKILPCYIQRIHN